MVLLLIDHIDAVTVGKLQHHFACPHNAGQRRDEPVALWTRSAPQLPKLGAQRAPAFVQFLQQVPGNEKEAEDAVLIQRSCQGVVAREEIQSIGVNSTYQPASPRHLRNPKIGGSDFCQCRPLNFRSVQSHAVLGMLVLASGADSVRATGTRSESVTIGTDIEVPPCQAQRNQNSDGAVILGEPFHELPSQPATLHGYPLSSYNNEPGS